MKTIQLAATGFFLWTSLNVFAQVNTQEPNVAPDCKSTFLTLGTGINSNYGMIGVGADIKVLDKLQVGLSGGIGSWGFKTAGELRYFYSGCMQQGSALTAGVAYATGLPEMEIEMELSNEETKTVMLELNAQTNLQLAWYRAFRVQQNHRFFIQAGYSFPISGISYRVISGETLSDVSKTTVRMMAPGGIIVAVGFGFGI
ncbi:MAG: hypothetical protein RL040_1376 [Bacteroidota bacterium]|jgi:hypothetical protein